MKYENVETYLNEEVRKLIKWSIEKLDKKDQIKVMNVVDFICWKYIEDTSLLKQVETIYKEETGKEIDFKKVNELQGIEMKKHYDLLKDGWDSIKSPCTEEENKLIKENYLKYDPTEELNEIDDGNNEA